MWSTRAALAKKPDAPKKMEIVHSLVNTSAAQKLDFQMNEGLEEAAKKQPKPEKNFKSNEMI